PVDGGRLRKLVVKADAQRLAQAHAQRRPWHLTVVGPDADLAAARAGPEIGLGLRGRELELADRPVRPRLRRIRPRELAQRALLGGRWPAPRRTEQRPSDHQRWHDGARCGGWDLHAT